MDFKDILLDFKEGSMDDSRASDAWWRTSDD